MRIFYIVVALLLAMVTSVQAQQRTRVYLMRGLGHFSPFGPLKRDLRAQGYIVQISGWSSWRRVARDALRHSNDRIIIGGHSMGDKTAFYAGETVRSRGVPVRVIGMDPLCTYPQGYPNLAAVNIWGNYCGRNPGTVPNAENVYINGGGHVFYPTNPQVRAEFVRATYWSNF